jgi:hypothetical protein
MRRRAVWLVAPAMVATVGLACAAGCTAIIGDLTERGIDASVADSGSDGTTVADGATDAGSLPGFDVVPTPPAHAKITFVHAAPGVFPVRLCIATGTSPSLAAGVYAFPNNVAQQGSLQYFPYLGLQSGSGATLPDLGDFEGVDVTLFAINATAVRDDASSMGASEPDCAGLLGANGQGAGGGGLVLNTDYIELPAIPSGTFTHGASFLVVMEGCLGGYPSTDLQSAQDVCGSTYDSAHAAQPLGNVGLRVYQVDTSAPPPGTLGIQVLHAASEWDGFFVTLPLRITGPSRSAQAVANTFGVTDQALDGGGANAPIATLIAYGAPLTPDAAAPQILALADYGMLQAYTTLSAPDGGAIIDSYDDSMFPATFGYGTVTVTSSFPEIQAFSGHAYAEDGGPAMPLYVPGANYTLVRVGDQEQALYINPADGGASTADAAVLNPGCAHFLMFPNDPVVPAL